MKKYAINIQWDIDISDLAIELYDLPDKVEIPTELYNNKDREEYIEAISDFLSDEYGYCHNGFEIIEE